jgi:hypothetical protein
LILSSRDRTGNADIGELYNANLPAGTPFPAGFTDLQSWTRDASNGGIEPDWCG